MTQEELIALLSAHEWSDIEFKEAQQAVPRNAYETVAAFANTAGGHLVFGIKKEGPAFEVVGVLDVDKVQNEFISALRQRDKISQIIDIKEQLYTLKGQDLLIFYIPEATRTEKPVYLNGDLRRAFIRKGGADVKCSDGELRRLLRDADQERYDNTPLPEFKVETVFDEETVSWYRQQFERRNPEHQKAESNLAFLYTWNFLLEDAERLVPTRAAVLLFGTERCVRQILPRPVLDYQRIDTPFSQWSPEERWHDRMIFEENIFKTWRGLVGKYMRIAEHPFSLDPTTLRRNDDPPDYVSFREAAINLLIHQDYGDHTRKPVIKFFTDQTVFWNPGDAFNTAEELLDPTEKEVRNPAIVKAFRRIGMSDQAGTGIRSIFRNWHDLGNVPPELHNDKAKKTFELILRKEILLTPEQKAFQQSISVSLSAQEASVFAYATEHDRVSLTDLRALTNCTHVQAKALATRLVQQVLLVELAESLFELAPVMKKRFDHAAIKMINPESQQVTQQVTQQVKQLLEIMVGEMTRKQLMDAVALKDRVNFARNYLEPALADDLIEMTQPASPNSPTQKYRLTLAGQTLLNTRQEQQRMTK
jgi:ATP-dependent DNA helicase RecG